MRLKDGNLCGLEVLLVARDDVVDALAHGGEILHGILEVVELGTDAVSMVSASTGVAVVILANLANSPTMSICLLSRERIKLAVA